MMKFIGGPVDGKWYRVNKEMFDRGYIRVETLKERPIFLKDLSKEISPIEETYEQHTYIKTCIMGEHGEAFYFFRWNKFSMNKVLYDLFGYSVRLRRHRERP